MTATDCGVSAGFSSAAPRTKLLEAEPPAPTDRVYRFEPEPFTDELWSHYRMTKKAQTPLSLNRDHPAWEDGPDLCCPRRKAAP